MPLNALNRDMEEEERSAAELGFDHRVTAHLIRALEPPPVHAPPEGSCITVHAAVSRFSVLYERIRNAVDYREDHLLRKGAIERILKRQLLLETDPYVIATYLIRELIGARYLPNGTLPDSLINDTALRVQKYQAIARTRTGGERDTKWLLGIIAAELEDLLVNPAQEKAIVTFLYERLLNRIVLKARGLEEAEYRLQLYVACYRALVKADDESVGYRLLRAYLPEWNDPESWLEEPRPVAERLVALRQKIRGRIKHPLSVRLLRAVKPWAVSLSLLVEVVMDEKERGALLASREDIHLAVSRITERREREVRGKLRRGTIRAMIYLFLTKMLFAVVIELPIEQLLYDEWSMQALAINIGFPPILMLFIGILIRPPGEANRSRIVGHVDELLGARNIPSLDVRMPGRRSGFALFLMRLVYAFTFLLSFGAVGWLLYQIHFTWVAAVIFFFFLSVVSFFGYRLRQGAREIMVVRPKERLSSTLIDFFSLPILRVGQWLSVTVSRVNVFVFIFDFLIEAPFKLFLNVMEDWLSFMREKKEELTDER